MLSRFAHIQYDGKAVEQSAKFKELVEGLEKAIIMEFPNYPQGQPDPSGRYKALAFTALEECHMWLGKAIRDQQISRGRKVSEINEGSQGNG